MGQIQTSRSNSRLDAAALLSAAQSRATISQCIDVMIRTAPSADAGQTPGSGIDPRCYEPWKENVHEGVHRRPPTRPRHCVGHDRQFKPSWRAVWYWRYRHAQRPLTAEPRSQAGAQSFSHSLLRPKVARVAGTGCGTVPRERRRRAIGEGRHSGGAVGAGRRGIMKAAEALFRRCVISTLYMLSRVRTS